MGDLENESKYGVTKFAKAFLQIPDNLERAAGSAKEEDLANDQELRKMKEGVVKMQKVVEDALKQFGVTEMKAEGAVFNPSSTRLCSRWRCLARTLTRSSMSWSPVI